MYFNHHFCFGARMQRFIRFINNISETTEESKGADTGFLRMRVLFQHITPENPGNIELPGQNVQNCISQQSFGTTYALPLTGFLKEPHQRTAHSPPKPRSRCNATTDSNCRTQGQRLKPGQALGEGGAGASGWAVAPWTEAFTGAVGVRGVGLERRFLRARVSRHSLH